jgi:hypothetical protein
MGTPLHSRGYTDTCVKCKHKFKAGDRVQMIYIVQGIGHAPHNQRELGAMLGEDFEMGHLECADPTLNGTVILSRG